MNLKAVAGTGQAIGFGYWGFVGRVQDLDYRRPKVTGIPYFLELFPGGGRLTDVRVRRDYDPAASPAVYSTNTGIVKLTDEGSHADIVRQLREVLKRDNCNAKVYHGGMVGPTRQSGGGWRKLRDFGESSAGYV
jgi:hypothetical protein